MCAIAFSQGGYNPREAVFYPYGEGDEVKIVRQSGGGRYDARKPKFTLTHTFKIRYVLIRLAVGALGLGLIAWPGFAQTRPSEQSAPEVSAGDADLFSRVIANQKRVDAELNVYERVERVEIRKTGSDPNPSEVKVWRVFPAGTGMSKIPLTAEAKPASADGGRLFRHATAARAMSPGSIARPAQSWPCTCSLPIYPAGRGPSRTGWTKGKYHDPCGGERK